MVQYYKTPFPVSGEGFYFLMRLIIPKNKRHPLFTEQANSG
jgi:hypothetical protein